MPQQTKKPKTKEEIIEQIKPVLKENNVRAAGIYGSYARGEAQADSDLDLLANFNKQISLFDLTGVEQELEEKLALDVDLVTFNSVSEYLAPYIKADLEMFIGEMPEKMKQIKAVENGVSLGVYINSLERNIDLLQEYLQSALDNSEDKYYLDSISRRVDLMGKTIDKIKNLEDEKMHLQREKLNRN